VSGAADKQVRFRLHRSYIEFAAMLKAIGKGTLEKLEEIKAQFCLQEGVSEDKADKYIQLFHKAKLIRMTDGHKAWLYNSDAEWELFKINV